MKIRGLSSISSNLCVFRVHFRTSIFIVILHVCLIVELLCILHTWSRSQMLHQMLGNALKLLACSCPIITRYERWFLLHLLLEQIGLIYIILLLLFELLILFKRFNCLEATAHFLLDQALFVEAFDVLFHGPHILGFLPQLMQLLFHALKLGHFVGNCLSLGFLISFSFKDLLLGPSPECPCFH